jgi:hypothetical protein
LLGDSEVDDVVDDPRREGEAMSDPEGDGDKGGDPGQHGVQHVEDGSDEHEGELHRLGDPGDEGGQGGGEEDAAHNGSALRICGHIHGQGGAGQPEEHDGEEPGHEQPALRAPGLKEAGEIAELEPDDGVDDMMKAEGDQQAVEEGMDRRAQGPGLGGPVPHCSQPLLRPVPDQPEHNSQDHRCEGGDDGDEPFAAEESQPLGKLDGVEALIEISGQQSAQDAGKHPHIGRLLEAINAGADVGQDLRQHPVTDRPGQAGRPNVGGEADGHTDGEQQGQVAEDHPTRIRQPWDVQQVRLPEPQQDPRRREHGDRQHQRTTDPLQGGKHGNLLEGEIERCGNHLALLELASFLIYIPASRSVRGRS